MDIPAPRIGLQNFQGVLSPGSKCHMEEDSVHKHLQRDGFQNFETCALWNVWILLNAWYMARLVAFLPLCVSPPTLTCSVPTGP